MDKKTERREAKRRRKMKVSGRSLKTLAGHLESKGQKGASDDKAGNKRRNG